MSIKNNILINIINQNNITDNSYIGIYHTVDHNYKIHFSRKNSLSLFNNEYEYICKISIYNNLDILLKEITTTELDIQLLIDNLNQLLDSSNTVEDIHFYFNTTDPYTISSDWISFQKRNDNIYYINIDNIIQFQSDKENLYSLLEILYTTFYDIHR